VRRTEKRQKREKREERTLVVQEGDESESGSETDESDEERETEKAVAMARYNWDRSAVSTSFFFFRSQALVWDAHWEGADSLLRCSARIGVDRACFQTDGAVRDSTALKNWDVDRDHASRG
jgi:hypothetical protein